MRQRPESHEHEHSAGRRSSSRPRTILPARTSGVRSRLRRVANSWWREERLGGAVVGRSTLVAPYTTAGHRAPQRHTAHASGSVFPQSHRLERHVDLFVMSSSSTSPAARERRASNDSDTFPARKVLSTFRRRRARRPMSVTVRTVAQVSSAALSSRRRVKCSTRIRKTAYL